MGGGGGLGPLSRGGEEDYRVASGHPALENSERRAGRASGKFQAAAEGSLQRALHSPGGGA